MWVTEFFKILFDDRVIEGSFLKVFLIFCLITNTIYVILLNVPDIWSWTLVLLIPVFLSATTLIYGAIRVFLECRWNFIAIEDYKANYRLFGPFKNQFGGTFFIIICLCSITDGCLTFTSIFLSSGWSALKIFGITVLGLFLGVVLLYGLVSLLVCCAPVNLNRNSNAQTIPHADQISE